MTAAVDISPVSVRVPPYVNSALVAAKLCRWLRVAAAAMALPLAPSVARAQSDFYNTDVGRPSRVEDAYAVARYALDAHLAPVTIAWGRGTGASWRIEPELTYGLVPRTQIELGLPVAYRGERLGLAGINITALHNLNAETTSWPALGIRGGVLMSVGQLAPERTYSSLTGVATRTYDWARLNVNAGYTFGTAPAADAVGDVTDVRRWLAGAAVDRSFPVQALMLSAEAYAEQPLDEMSEVVWTIGTALRYQLTPYYTVNAGVGTSVTGNARPVFITFGVGRAMGTKVLMPGLGRWGR